MTANDIEMCQLLVAAGMPKADAVDIVERIVEPYEQEVAKLKDRVDLLGERVSKTEGRINGMSDVLAALIRRMERYA